MASPAKRRKLNGSSKTSPAPSRNLDFFFGKQKQNVPSQPPNSSQQTEESHFEPELTDEQFARKLQAQWDEEDAARGQTSGVSPAAAQDHKEETYLDGHGGNKEEIEEDGLDGKPDVASESVEAEVKPSDSKGSTLSLQSTGSAEDAITSSIPFDESPLVFEPSKYVADLQSHWAVEGGNASYALLTRCFVLVNSTQSRIKIVDTLVNLLRVIIEGDPSSLLPTVRAKFVMIIINYYPFVLRPNLISGCFQLS